MEVPSFGTDRQLRQAYALRAMLMHFRDQFDAIGDAGAIEVKALTEFVRFNATHKKIRDRFDQVKDAFATYLRARGVSVHRDLRALHRVVFDRAPTDVDLPHYISEGGIETAYFSSKERTEDFLRPIEGCWWVYRASSTAAGSVNRAFLNIKPIANLSAENSRTPKFSIYYSEDGEDDGHATGALYATIARINFVGARVSDTTQHPLTMVWRNTSDAPNQRRTEATGVLLVPNSKGAQITTNVLAVRMDKQPGPNKGDYEAFKKEAQKLCRDLPLADLADPLSSAQRERLATILASGVFFV